MPRKSLDYEGVEARSQGNCGINSVGWIRGVKNIIVFKQRGVCFV